MKFFLSILFLFCATQVVAQTSNSCSCVDNTFYGTKSTDKPQVQFNLSGTKNIGLCGYFDEALSSRLQKKVFSEAYIFDCNKKAILYEWGAKQSCIVDTGNDTIRVKELSLLPIGEKFESILIPFYTTEIYLENGAVNMTHYYQLNQHHYSQKELKTVEVAYEQLKADSHEWNSTKYLDLCYQLFWAYISGSKKAKKYLLKAEEKFGGFDGHISEEYHDIIATCKHIDEIN